MNQIKIFNDDSFGKLEVLLNDGEELFSLDNVAWSLGYTRATNGVLYLRKDRIQNIIEKLDIPIFDRGGQKYIDENGLYEFIFESGTAAAKDFRKWVTGEVLPSIRKHGAYMTDDVLEKTLEDPDYMIGLLNNLKEERQKRKTLEVKTLMLEQQVAEAQPKLTYYDTILNSNKLVTITQIAKDYGLSGKALNKILHEEGIQYKLSGQWLLYHQYSNKGYTKSQTHIDQTGEARMNTKWTQKGRLFIHEILIRLGYDPDKKIA